MNSVTRHQAAVMLGVTDQTISNYCKEGLLTHYKGKGNILYIDKDELEIYKAQIKITHASEERLKMKQMHLADAMARVDAADCELRGVLLAHKPKHDSLASVIENLYSAEFIPKMSRRECTMMKKFIQGVDSRDLAEEFNLSVCRVQQIIEKAIRRFEDFDIISTNMKTHASLEEQIKNLQLENDMLKKQIAKLRKEEEFNPSEYLTTLLNSRIVDYNISIRAYKILLNFRDDGMYGNHVSMVTIGDLAMKSDGRLNILRQRNCGKKTYYELEDLLESLNLDFKGIDESELDYYKRMQARFDNSNDKNS